MSFISDLVNGYKIASSADNVRSLLDTFISSTYTSEPDFFDKISQPSITGGDETVGLTDVVVSSSELYSMVHKDPYFSGLFEQLVQALFKGDFYIDVQKDKNGQLLGNKETAMRYENLLRSIDYIEKVEKQLYATLADGGGNALLFTVKNDNERGFEFRVEPFLDVGRTRVKVYGKDSTRKIHRYEVVDANGKKVWSLNPKENIVKHIRYTSSGDYRFSTNPAKRAVYWYVLKKNISGANLATYNHGLQDAVLASPDYSALNALVTAMSSGNSVTAKEQAAYLKDPIKFLAKQSILDDEILRTIAGNPRKSNIFTKLKMPYRFEKVGRSNVDMETTKLIALCDAQMGYALRTSKGVIDTRDSKYSNAEIEKDNWSNFVTDPIKKQQEMIAESFYLPLLDPDYDPNIYKMRFGRDPNSEDIAIFNARTTRAQAEATIINTLSGIEGYEYNLETNKIIKIGEDVVDSEDDLDRKVRSAQNIVQKSLNSTSKKKFERIIRTSISKQLENYVSKISSRLTLEELQDTLREDLQSIANFGLNVSIFKDQLLKFALIGKEEFEESTKTSKRATFEESIVDLMDAKSQLMIKGWDSLTLLQKRKLTKFYSKDLKGYKGLDETTVEDINTMLQNIINDPGIATGKFYTDEQGIEQEVYEKPGINTFIDELTKEMSNISKTRAKLIAETEVSQGVEATRYNFYYEAGFNEKHWYDVNDSNVRESHKDNSAQGWIPIDDEFSSGERTPAEAIRCRCTLVFRKTEPKLLA